MGITLSPSLRRSRLRIPCAVTLLLLVLGAGGQVTLCAWNIQNFGKSKSDSQVVYMASLLRGFDVIGIVEVVAGNGGAQAVARLADALDRTGSKWDYSISDPTSGTPGSSERYAFLWKAHRVKRIGKPFLDTLFEAVVEREPYIASFSSADGDFSVALFHAIPKSKQPEEEIRYLKMFPSHYSALPLIFCGDFNCPQSHSVFGPLRSAGYLPALEGCKTSLKTQAKNGECTASEYDNVFYPSDRIAAVNAGFIPFYTAFTSLRAARKISDHLPVYFEFKRAAQGIMR